MGRNMSATRAIKLCMTEGGILRKKRITANEVFNHVREIFKISRTSALNMLLAGKIIFSFF